MAAAGIHSGLLIGVNMWSPQYQASSITTQSALISVAHVSGSPLSLWLVRRSGAKAIMDWTRVESGNVVNGAVVRYNPHFQNKRRMSLIIINDDGKS